MWLLPKNSRSKNITLILVFLGMVGVIALSNFLVQFPFTPLGLQNLLTWGALSYPLVFLLNDITNRFYGYREAKRLLLVGFFAGIVISPLFSTWRISVASLSAFLVAQMLDANLFDRLRTHRFWWFPPVLSSLIASSVDTVLFFSMAFAGEQLPWVSWMIGDFLVKELIVLCSLFPYGLLLFWVKRASLTVEQSGHN